MNAAQRRAIDDAIDRAADNLSRAKLQQRHNPEWKSGNGVPIAELVKSWEKELAELRQ